MTTSVALETSSLIADRFILEEEIGRGELGVVYCGRDLHKEATGFGARVAIKLFNEQLKQHPNAVRAVLREARKAQALTHPNIVKVYDVGRHGHDAYVSMELLEGETLDRLIHRSGGRGVGIEKALKIIRDVCDAMSYAHGHLILHTGFKPANVLITHRGIVKVLDFGLARAARCNDWANTVLSLYDPESPKALTAADAGYEGADGTEPDVSDDIYAVACVFYELLTGKHPFGGRSAEQASKAQLRAIRPAVLSRLQWRVLQQALEFRRHRRPLSAMEFLEGLQPKRKLRGLNFGWAAVTTIAIVGTLSAAHVLTQGTFSLNPTPAPTGKSAQPQQTQPANAQPRQTPAPTASAPAVTASSQNNDSTPKDPVPPAITQEQAQPTPTLAQPKDPDSLTEPYTKEEMAVLYARWKAMKNERPAQSRRSPKIAMQDNRSRKRGARSTRARSSPEQKTESQALKPVALSAPKPDDPSQIALLKERLLAQARQNQIEAAIVTLSSLSDRLLPSDTFLVTDAPEAIATAYLRLASDAVKNGNIEDALSLAIHGSKIAPAFREAAVTRDRYLGYWEVSDLLRNRERISTAHLKIKMWRVARLAPHETAAIRQRWERDLAARIRATQDPKLAARLSRVGQSLFGNDSDLTTPTQQATAEANSNL